MSPFDQMREKFGTEECVLSVAQFGFVRTTQNSGHKRAEFGKPPKLGHRESWLRGKVSFEVRKNARWYPIRRVN